MPNQLTIYHCEFCEFDFALFKAFPEDIIPYCPNCSNDEDVRKCVIKKRRAKTRPKPAQILKKPDFL